MRRPSLVFLLACALALAGCVRPAAELDSAQVAPADEGVEHVSRAGAPLPEAPKADAGAAVPAPPARIPFASAVELPLVEGIGGGEPNIAALPDGTLFVTAPAGGVGGPNALEGGAYLWRSKDNGTTWETLREPMSAPAGLFTFCSCDADVVTSPDGYVYYSDWWIALMPGNFLVERSSDGGDTWDAVSITTREAIASNVDRQWLVAGPDGFVGLFYSYFTPVQGLPPLTPELVSGVHAVFSTDHGETWGEPVVVAPRERGHALQIAHPHMLSDGTLVMPYGDVDIDAEKTYWRSPSQVKLAVSTDGGASWEHRVVADVPEGFDNLWAVQAAVDAVDRVHVAWAARVDDDTMAMYATVSEDVGETWATPLVLRAAGLNFLPWVAAFGEGTVGVGWYGGDATGDPTEADAPWYAYVAQSTDGGESFVVHRVTEEAVKVGSLCPKGAACRGDRELLDYVSLVYDATGALHYAFARSQEDVALTMVATALTPG